MFGFKIIKETEYDELKTQSETLKHNSRKKEYADKVFCDMCNHYKEHMMYIDGYPFMKVFKYCDLKCTCENFERKK